MPDESNDPLEDWQEVTTKVEKWLKDNEELRGMLNLSDDALDKLSKVNAWVGTAIGVLRLAGVFPDGPDPLAQLYHQLDARMQKILEEVEHHDLNDRIDELEDLRQTAVTQAQRAQSYVNDPGHGDLHIEDQASETAVNKLTDFDSMKWKHLPFPLLMDREIPTPTEKDGNVWDYRWALPETLKAILARLVLLDAIDPDHTTTYRDQLGSYANVLREIHRRITEHIKPIQLVTVTDSAIHQAPGLLMRHFPERYLRYYWRGVYSIPLREINTRDLMSIAVRCGAVDVLSASTTISDWYPLDKPPRNDVEVLSPPYSEFDKDKYFAAFASETRSRWLGVYDAVGLDLLARIVTKLKLLARADEVPKSLREMAGAFEAQHFPPEPGGVHVSLKSLLHWVGIGEKGSLTQLQSAALKEKLFSYVPEVINGALTRESLTPV